MSAQFLTAHKTKKLNQLWQDYNALLHFNWNPSIAVVLINKKKKNTEKVTQNIISTTTLLLKEQRRCFVFFFHISLYSIHICRHNILLFNHDKHNKLFYFFETLWKKIFVFFFVLLFSSCFLTLWCWNCNFKHVALKLQLVLFIHEDILFFNK